MPRAGVVIVSGFAADYTVSEKWRQRTAQQYHCKRPALHDRIANAALVQQFCITRAGRENRRARINRRSGRLKRAVFKATVFGVV